MPRAEADGPLALHLRAIGKDECIYDDADVFAVLQAAARIEELERFLQRFIDVGYEFGDPTQLIDLHDEAVGLNPESR